MSLKKAVNMLSLIALISLGLLIIIQLNAENSDLYKKFIADLLTVPLALLSVPLWGGVLCLAINKDIIKPKIWLSIYAGIIALLLILSVGYFEQVRDLPLAFQKKCASIEGKVDKVTSTEFYQNIYIENQEYNVPKVHFNEAVPFK